MFLLLASAAILYFLYAMLGGAFQKYRAHTLRSNLEKKIEQAHRTIDSLETMISKLKSDTGFIEKIAREKHGMAKPDEKVFRFMEDEK